MTANRTARGRAVALLVSAVFGLSGCSLFQGTDEPAASSAGGPSQQRCDTLLAVPTDTAGLDTVQLVADGSASTIPRATGQSGVRRPDWAVFLASKAKHDPKALVSFGVFGGRLDMRGTVGAPGGSNDLYRDGNDAKDFGECLTRTLRAAFTAAPDQPGTDPLRALADAGEQLAGKDGARRIVLATDGLSNAGCGDLRGASIGDPSVIAKIVQSCGPEIPTFPKEVHIDIHGLGRSVAGWPDISTPNRTWLVDLWTALCHETGATCDEVDSAAPDTTTGQLPAAAPEDPQVKMPEILIKGTNPLVIVVPDPLLFDLDSADLAPRAQSSIGEILAKLSEINYKRLVVQGHTDSQGQPDYNQDLSERRAGAVLRALASRVHDASSVGLGEQQPACPLQIVNGVPDQAAMACNRRVEILVYV